MSIKLDWVRDELRELFDDLLNDWLLGELTALGGQLELDAGATLEVEVVAVCNFVRTSAI